MPSRDDAYLRHQLKLWLRPDGDRWVRPDAARFLAPGADVVAAFPVLARKYSAAQPRVPAGNGIESGRWTDGSSSGRPRVYIDTTDLGSDAGDTGSGDSGFDFSWLLGSIDVGDIASEIDKLDLFGIKPGARDSGGIRLAGDPPAGIGDNGGPPIDEPPEVPKAVPQKSAQVTALLRATATWIGRALGLGVSIDILNRSLDEAEWLRERRAEIDTYRDPPRSLSELQDAVAKPRPGTEKHHIAEQTALERLGFGRREIDSPENLFRIPTLKHYDITAWYRQANVKYSGLTPRQYLADKSLEERMRVGREALVFFNVMKP